MPATTTDAEVARMANIVDATLADTFHWQRTEEERLYRDCPTAFWLGPDASFEIETPAEPIPREASELLNAPLTPTGYSSAITRAVVIAGPIFVASLSLVMEGSGPPLYRIAGGLGLALVSFPLTIPFGAIAALLPVMVGVALLAHLGSEHPLARDTRLWVATGAGLGLLIAALFDAGMVSVPIVLTAIACATIAHHAIHWIEPEPA